jgi:hypothetical protein
MFSLCYAQCLNYLLQIIFVSPSILQHYIEFDSHTMFTLEKLLGTWSFGITMSHLVYCKINLHVFSGGLFNLLPSPSWDVGFSLFLHLSFISNGMITLFFLMQCTYQNQHLSFATNIIWYPNFTTLDCLFTCPPFESLMV